MADNPTHRARRRRRRWRAEDYDYDYYDEELGNILFPYSLNVVAV
jgi:hypothetical protein